MHWKARNRDVCIIVFNYPRDAIQNNWSIPSNKLSVFAWNVRQLCPKRKVFLLPFYNLQSSRNYRPIYRYRLFGSYSQ